MDQGATSHPWRSYILKKRKGKNMQEGYGELLIDQDGNLMLAMEDGTLYTLEEIPDTVGNKVKVSISKPEALH